jgi:hypothetical protein
MVRQSFLQFLPVLGESRVREDEFLSSAEDDEKPLPQN